MASDPSPPLSIEEQLTLQFYSWEIRGRGWKVYDEPVVLEPPFRPFLGHWARGSTVAQDDGRRETVLSKLAKWMQNPRRLGSPDAAPVAALPPTASGTEDVAEPDEWIQEIVEFSVALPPDLVVRRDVAEEFLLSVSTLSHPMSFELVGTPGQVQIIFGVARDDATIFSAQLCAFAPDITVTEGSDVLGSAWGRDAPSLVVDFGLSEECVRPLRSPRSFDPDPLLGTLAALGETRDRETGILQVLFTPTLAPWAESMLRAVTDGDGGSFFADDREMVALAREKVSRPLYAAVVRVGAQAADEDRAWKLAASISGALGTLANLASNKLIALSNDEYPDRDHVADLLRRASRRSGMLLNLGELATLVHLPSASVRIEALRREVKRTRAAPVSLRGHPLVLGENRHRGATVTVSIPDSVRLRHTHVIGASGTGKSTLLLSMIAQDMEQGRGIAVFDPHGDLVDDALARVPDERIDDVIVIDPADQHHPVGLNPLSAHSELERTLLASDLVGVFRRLSTSWGDQMTSVLGNAVMAFLTSEIGGTLVDLRRFLVEADFRKSFLLSVNDSEVVYFWQKEFPLLAGRPQAPLLTRLDAFLRPTLIRNMVAQKETKVDFRKIVDDGKILLVKLAQGAIGEENAALLGAVLVAKIHQVAMSRQEIERETRRPFFLYLDEFHNFVTPSVSALLAGARKYGIGLVLAHQDLRQLGGREADLLGAVLTNPATRVCFRVGDEDARRLDGGFASFAASDLHGLAVGEAICRVDRSDHDFTVSVLPVASFEPTTARTRRLAVLERSRLRFAGTVAPAPLRAVASIQEPVQEAPPPLSRLEPPPRAPRVPVAPQPRGSPPVPGRGGPQHKYLQSLIAKWSEARGWKTTIEKRILDGLGHVDLALERGTLAIACEISVTTNPQWELGNVRKCLAGGFQYVALVASDERALRRAEAAIHPELSEEDRSRVRFVTPDGFFIFVDGLATESAESVSRIRGYSVAVRRRPVGSKEGDARSDAISRVIAAALRRMKSEK